MRRSSRKRSAVTYALNDSSESEEREDSPKPSRPQRRKVASASRAPPPDKTKTSKAGFQSLFQGFQRQSKTYKPASPAKNAQSKCIKVPKNVKRPPRRVLKKRQSNANEECDSSSESEDSVQSASDDSMGGRQLSKQASRRSSRRAAVSYKEADEHDFSDCVTSSFSSSDSEAAEDSPDEGPDKIERLLGARNSGEEEEFLAKFAGKAFVHCDWLSRKKVLDLCGSRGGGMISRLKSKMGRASYTEQADFENGVFFPPEYVTVERIVAIDPPDDHCEEDSFLVKWEGLGYESCTWEVKATIDKLEAQACVQIYLGVNKRALDSGPAVSSEFSKNVDSESALTDRIGSLPLKSSRTLRSYQRAGVQWLAFNWHCGRNSILADEMGLGKTVQSVATLRYLQFYHGVRGPFLIIAPLSTLQHWKREFREWTDFNTLVYHGNEEAKAVIREREWFFSQDGSKSTKAQRKEVYRFEVLITTYETALADVEVLGEVGWRALVVDEAQRLKNKQSSLSRVLRSQYRFAHSILLTGTPIQNNMTELHNLLSFLHPKLFSSEADFLGKFGQLQEASQLEALHKVLRPYLLRRMKQDVENSLKPRTETLIEVDLTPTQMKYYKAVYEKNTDFLVQAASGKKSKCVSLMNICMQLRKVCQHPFLLKGVEDKVMSQRGNAAIDWDSSEQTEEEVNCMVEASAKFALLDKMLPKLRARGSKVLIFSQMVRLLDILQDYLRFREYPTERIDGGVTGLKRQAAIDRYSDASSDSFVFLLCTRAGGVGINLTAADTVIIFDSDWNPQNDLQAQARCHRIGQTQQVSVYRLSTKNTYESEMMHRAALKLGLDKAVLGRMADNASKGRGKNDEMNSKEVETLLKKGAYHAFLESDYKAATLSESDIDAILDGAQASTILQFEKDAHATGASSSFAKASFVSGAGSTGEEELDMDDPDFWEKVGLKTELQKLPRRRSRKTVSRFTASFGAANLDDLSMREQLSDSGDDMTKAYDDDDAFKPEDSVFSSLERDVLLKCLSNVGWGKWDTLRDCLARHRFQQAALEGKVSENGAGDPQKDTEAAIVDAVAKEFSDDILKPFAASVIRKWIEELNSQLASKSLEKKTEPSADPASVDSKKPKSQDSIQFFTGSLFLCHLFSILKLQLKAAGDGDGNVWKAEQRPRDTIPALLSFLEQFSAEPCLQTKYIQNKLHKNFRKSLTALDRMALLDSCVYESGCGAVTDKRSHVCFRVSVADGMEKRKRSVNTALPCAWWKPAASGNASPAGGQPSEPSLCLGCNLNTISHDEVLLLGAHCLGAHRMEEMSNHALKQPFRTAMAKASLEATFPQSEGLAASQTTTTTTDAVAAVLASEANGAQSSSASWPPVASIRRRFRFLVASMRRARTNLDTLQAREAARQVAELKKLERKRKAEEVKQKKAQEREEAQRQRAEERKEKEQLKRQKAEQREEAKQAKLAAKAAKEQEAKAILAAKRAKEEKLKQQRKAVLFQSQRRDCPPPSLNVQEISDRIAKAAKDTDNAHTKQQSIAAACQLDATPAAAAAAARGAKKVLLLAYREGVKDSEALRSSVSILKWKLSQLKQELSTHLATLGNPTKDKPAGVVGWCFKLGKPLALCKAKISEKTGEGESQQQDKEAMQVNQKVLTEYISSAVARAPPAAQAETGLLSTKEQQLKWCLAQVRTRANTVDVLIERTKALEKSAKKNKNSIMLLIAQAKKKSKDPKKKSKPIKVAPIAKPQAPVETLAKATDSPNQPKLKEQSKSASRLQDCSLVAGPPVTGAPAKTTLASPAKSKSPSFLLSSPSASVPASSSATSQFPATPSPSSSKTVLAREFTTELKPPKNTKRKSAQLEAGPSKIPLLPSTKRQKLDSTSKKIPTSGKPTAKAAGAKVAAPKTQKPKQSKPKSVLHFFKPMTAK